MACCFVESEESMSFIKRRKGAVLALALVVLMFGVAFSGVTLYVVKNLFYSAKGVIDDTILIKAAESGVEMGKVWLAKQMDQAPPMPRHGEEVGDRIDVPGELEKLVVHRIEVPASENGGVSLEVTVYDLMYEQGSVNPNQLFASGPFPPKIDEDILKYIGSRKLDSSYAASNKGEGTLGSSFEEGKYGAYLVVSKASYQSRKKVIAEGIVVKLN